MRTNFASRLALLLVAGFLVVATQVWAGGTIEWLVIAGGIVMIALAAVAVIGLIVHEMTTERVVHELSVTRPVERTTSLAS